MSLLRNLAIAAIIVGSASVAFAQGSSTAPTGPNAAPQGSGTAPSGTSTSPQGSAKAPNATNNSPQGASAGSRSTAAASVNHAKKGRHLSNRTARRPSTKKLYSRATIPSRTRIYSRATMPSRHRIYNRAPTGMHATAVRTGSAINTHKIHRRLNGYPAH